jgi:hypothetical protein
MTIPAENLRIHRTTQSEHYTIVPNDLIRDEAMSYGARGCLIRILSNRGDWHVTADSMWRGTDARSGEGRDTYRRWFREMEAAGYLTRRAVTAPSPAGGVKMVTELHFYDTPLPPEQRTCGKRPTPGIQSSGRPAETHESPAQPDDGIPGVGATREDGVNAQLSPTTEYQASLRSTNEKNQQQKHHQGNDEPAVGRNSGKDNPGTGSGRRVARAGGGTARRRTTRKRPSRAERASEDEFQALARRMRDTFRDDFDFRPEILAPRFREVAKQAAMSPNLLEDAICWWVGAWAEGFRSYSSLLEPDQDGKTPNPAGYLHKVLPDLVAAYLTARDKQAAELGVEAEGFAYADWLLNEEEAAADQEGTAA